MTITFLALVSLLPQQLTKLHQLAMQQTPFPPLGQTNPAFPGTYPAAPSDPLSPPRGLLLAHWLCSGREQSGGAPAGGRAAGRAGGPCVPEVGWSRPGWPLVKGRLPGARPAECARRPAPFVQERELGRAGRGADPQEAGRVPGAPRTPDGTGPAPGESPAARPPAQGAAASAPGRHRGGGAWAQLCLAGGLRLTTRGASLAAVAGGARQTHRSAAASQVLSFPSRVASLISLRAKR